MRPRKVASDSGIPRVCECLGRDGQGPLHCTILDTGEEHSLLGVSLSSLGKLQGLRGGGARSGQAPAGGGMLPHPGRAGPLAKVYLEAPSRRLSLTVS